MCGLNEVNILSAQLHEILQCQLSGHYLLVANIVEGDKVKAEIVRILTNEHQKEFTKNGVWPKKFTTKRESEAQCDDEEGNLNRRKVSENSSDSDSSSDMSQNN